MPQVHVVDKRIALEDLTSSLVRPRAKAADRDLAIAAILRANPGLAVGQPVPAGTVVVIPVGVAEVRVAGDPSTEAIDDLLGRVRQGIEDLSTAAEEGEKDRTEAKKETQRVLSSSAVRRAIATQPLLQEAVDEGRADLRERDADARKASARFRTAKEQWGAELDELRALFPG